MGATIDCALQLKRREYIALLDKALDIAEGLTKEIDAIEHILAEKFSEQRVA